MDYLSENFEEQRNIALVEKWARNVEAVREASGGNYSDQEAVGLAILLENTQREMNRSLNEVTQATAIGPFKRYAFDILTAVMPSIISNDIVSVQPQ